ncbi:MAG TPA: ATP-binding protein [Propionicimonas sp.]|jgi:signal transduction histidine kinase
MVDLPGTGVRTRPAGVRSAWSAWFPWRSLRFWVIQAVIVAIMGLHVLALRTLDGRDLAGIPTPLTSNLMLIPVLYAAVTFGTKGAAATSVWAVALFGLHWAVFYERAASTEHVPIELVGLAVLAASGIVVGRHVDEEHDGRRRLEGALERLALTETRYRDLFDRQPSPVVVTDESGLVVELNTAAERLLGTAALGAPLRGVLGTTSDELASAETVWPLRTGDGEERQYLVSANRVGAPAQPPLTQVVLIDVTEQHRRFELQRALTAGILRAQEEERLHLARELHDDPLQQLTYLTRVLDDSGRPAGTQEAAREARRVADGAAVGLRRLIRGLRPPVLDDLGLLPALRQLASEVQERSGVTVELRAAGTDVRPAPEIELAAYRIAQEALSNVARHACATRVSVDLALGDQLVLTVADDGRGFATRRRAAGFGLAGMRERATLAGGAVTVQSHAGRGTTVSLTLPMRYRADDGDPGASADPSHPRIGRD